MKIILSILRILWVCVWRSTVVNPRPIHVQFMEATTLLFKNWNASLLKLSPAKSEGSAKVLNKVSYLQKYFFTQQHWLDKPQLSDILRAVWLPCQRPRGPGCWMLLACYWGNEKNRKFCPTSLVMANCKLLLACYWESETGLVSWYFGLSFKNFNPPANNSLPALQKAAPENLVHVRAVMTSESWSFPQQADDGLGKYKWLCVL